MSHPSNQANRAATSGGPFAKRPREMLVWILEFFTMYEVAQLQRFVCLEFSDAGQERIRERGGRKLFEEGAAFFHGLDHYIIDQDRARLLFRASIDAGCKIALADNKMLAPNLSDEEKQKILKDLKEIGTSSPYHWVDYFIGVCYQRGWGGEERKNQAVKWVERAAHKGNTTAMCTLGVDYHEGKLGLIQSDTKANELYALAAEKGCANARCNLGNSYRYGTGDLAIDFNRCVELYEQSANQGSVNAQVDLANMYKLGSEDGPPMTIPVDYQLSFRWFYAAAKQEHVIAMFRVGLAYSRGRGVVQNDESAFEWYMKAAKKNDEYAQCYVGICYEHGRGREIDLIQAIYWYQKSAAQGYQLAIDSVARLNRNIRIRQRTRRARKISVQNL